MRATELNSLSTNKTTGFGRPLVFEAAEVSEAVSSCPFRATCGSPRCDGDWTTPNCPGGKKGM